MHVPYFSTVPELQWRKYKYGRYGTVTPVTPDEQVKGGGQVTHPSALLLVE